MEQELSLMSTVKYLLLPIIKVKNSHHMYCLACHRGDCTYSSPVTEHPLLRDFLG